ncbi:DUF421 domain-containing protein [Mucilaginibacter litoreus]|uniref:DUF421 domain-containing protein n=1 Tax=Mucilaginibacter litoreus TaxID=1048221 RepID=A0ABW3AUD5_9SPHI
MSWSEVFVKDLDFHFAIEIIVRTLIMFALILIILRLTGKKGVRQLSIFEVAIIIGFGSAAGDPMFTKDIAIVPSVIVLVTILVLYRLVTWIATKSERFESVLEGEPMYIIEEGRFVLIDKAELTFAKDEFLSEMRQQSIEHLGQVRIAVLETTGNVSFYYYSDEEVKPGMPVLPKPYNLKSKTIGVEGDYACTYCGDVKYINSQTHKCERCGREEWVKAIVTKRLS